MHHEFLDRFAHLESPIHRLDPRAKILATAAFVVAVVVTPFDAVWVRGGVPFGPYLLLLILLAVASRVPLSYLLLRSLVVIPFILLLVVFIPLLGGETILVELPLGLRLSQEGLVECIEILVKAYTAILAILLLTSTTRFSLLLQGLSTMGLSRALILILSFLYRYIFVLVDEVHRLRRAAASRGGGRRRRIRTLGSMLGVLFLRTFERAERVYDAMLSRGLSGEIRTMTRLRWAAPDSIFLILVLGFVAALSIAGWAR